MEWALKMLAGAAVSFRNGYQPFPILQQTHLSPICLFAFQLIQLFFDLAQFAENVLLCQ